MAILAEATTTPEWVITLSFGVRWAVALAAAGAVVAVPQAVSVVVPAIGVASAVAGDSTEAVLAEVGKSFMVLLVTD